MLDMSETTKAKSDQLNSVDLVAPMTILITNITKVNDDQQPIAIDYEGGEGRPYKPSKGMRRGLVALWGLDGEKYIGRSMTLFCNPTVTWAGKEEGGIQISHASNIDKPVKFKLALARGKSTIHTVDPLVECVPASMGGLTNPKPKKTLISVLKADCDNKAESMKAVFENLTGLKTMKSYPDGEKLLDAISNGGERRQEYVDLLGAIGLEAKE